MDIELKKEQSVEIFTLKGRLDQSGAEVLQLKFNSVASEETKRFHFNLSQLEFINSFGLGTLLLISKDIRLAKGRLTFSDLNNYISEIFDETLLSRIFEIFPSQEEALYTYQSDITNTNIINCEQHF